MGRALLTVGSGPAALTADPTALTTGAPVTTGPGAGREGEVG